MEDQSNMKQTAVKWLEEQLIGKNGINVLKDTFNQAKEMEKDQAKEIWNASQENMHRQFSSSAYKPITFDQWYSNRNK